MGGITRLQPSYKLDAAEDAVLEVLRRRFFHIKTNDDAGMDGKQLWN